MAAEPGPLSNGSNEETITEKFKGFIQCTFCYEYPSAPFYKCGNGHTICENCAEKMGPCGFCKVKLIRSLYGDKMLRELGLKSRCMFSGAGCKRSFNCDEIKDHLASCFYRDITCNETDKFCTLNRNGVPRRVQCDNVRVPFHKYGHHLEQLHSFTRYEGPSVEILRVLDPSATKAARWRFISIAYDGFTFLWQVYATPDHLFSWMTILGDDEDAGNYTCTLSFTNPTPFPVAYERRLTSKLKVLPFHNYSPLAMPPVGFAPPYSSAPIPQLLKYCVPDGKLEKFQANIILHKKCF